MARLTLDDLLAACAAGGASTLVCTTELTPAGGMHALVAPAKYLQGKNATYLFERRFVDGEALHTVVLDSRTSHANRVEAALVDARAEGVAAVSAMPVIEVTYTGPDGLQRTLTDLEIPHRATDAHVRASTLDGKPVTEAPAYRAARDSSPSNANALFELSPVSVALGIWDSTRKVRQARFPAALVGEVIAVLADQAEPDANVSHRSGARIDPLIGMDNFTATDAAQVQAAMREPGAPAPKKATRASELLLGTVPPGTTALDGVAVQRVIRTSVLSFATLRRLRFPGTDEVAVRALLAALLVYGMVRSGTDLYLRANCHLNESGEPTWILDGRNGAQSHLDPLTLGEAEALLDTALDHARSAANVRWDGQSLELTGNPTIAKLAGSADDQNDA